MPAPQPIYLDNDFTIRHALRRLNLEVGRHEPIHGASVRAWIAASVADDAPIGPGLEIPLTEIGTTGEYVGVIDGGTLRDRLAGHVGQVVWEVVRLGTDYRAVAKLEVVATREAS